MEPLGLLRGDEARAALAAGLALPFGGGLAASIPVAFTMVRAAGSVLSAREAARRWPAATARLSTPPPCDWAGLGDGPLAMGILNVTPDSFSDGDPNRDVAAAIAAGERMLADGADIIDVGGESTRPGANPLSPTTEQFRILPVIRALVRAGAVVSVDTRHADTMHRALDDGARIVNDVSALAGPGAAAVVARHACPVVLMHMRGTPLTMRDLATYDDVVPDVAAELAARVDAALAAGIHRARIALDPGFGFAKTAEHNLLLMRRLPLLAALGLPIVAGISRKNTIGMLTGEDRADRRDPGSLAAHLFCLDRGARILRAHDVPGTRQAIRVWSGLHRGGD